MAFLDLATERYSERRFSARPIEREKLAAILEAARVAPTARNLQPQRILVVESAGGLAKMDRCTKCRFGAPTVLVLTYDMTLASRSPDVMDFGIVDTSIAATHMMLQAQELGIHSCWVGLIDPPELRRQFDIPRTHRIVSVMPIGYPSDESAPSPMHEASIPLDEMVCYERFGEAGDRER
ncbi:nitroreductase family protein [Enorma burkinafasonensis]|uniref:nitroreductase family protein n=1 Tax=Enorma burkinafasonensis TaxID=2590867 RepID=UPI0011A3BA4C|nr:nitroreductase family protein [Enorma burkinafasonensis]